MLVLRCTTKYRKRLELPAKLPDLPEPVNALGSWYANVLNVGAHRMLHYMSSRALLSVIVPLREAKTAEQRLRVGIESVLQHIGARPDLINAEIATLTTVGRSPARNRSVLASMRDQALSAAYQLGRGDSHEQTSNDLVITPCGPLNHESPKRIALQLLADKWG